MQAHGRHAKEENLAVSAIQSMLILLITLACYTRRLIQLEKRYNLSLVESFFIRDNITMAQ